MSSAPENRNLRKKKCRYNHSWTETTDWTEDTHAQKELTVSSFYEELAFHLIPLTLIISDWSVWPVVNEKSLQQAYFMLEIWYLHWNPEIFNEKDVYHQKLDR